MLVAPFFQLNDHLAKRSVVNGHYSFERNSVRNLLSESDLDTIGLSRSKCQLGTAKSRKQFQIVR